MLSGRAVDAAEADRIGLVNRVGDDPVAMALEVADAIVRNSPYGVQMTKEVMWSQLEVASLQAGIDLENRTQVMLSLTRDHKEAVLAFTERRPAVFHND
jgi:enoyl-CoA hydratase